MKLITKEIAERFEKVGDQSESKNPLIVVKYFDPAGSATWYATAYNPKNRVAYGYVTGLQIDEWGYFSMDELQAVERPFGLTIERDIYFEEQHFNTVFRDQQRITELAQRDKNKEQEKENTTTLEQ
ncbi:DUF2958 domain-containing protein [Polaribacter sp.]|uniref:DUF2958 domain-containing protein n=1 Tax=Polaribacter sp. TaxID=1920175 RepID=UPI003F6B6742